jgi:hypothetical protein
MAFKSRARTRAPYSLLGAATINVASDVGVASQREFLPQADDTALAVLNAMALRFLPYPDFDAITFSPGGSGSFASSPGGSDGFMASPGGSGGFVLCHTGSTSRKLFFGPSSPDTLVHSFSCQASPLPAGLTDMTAPGTSSGTSRKLFGDDETDSGIDL